MAVTTERRTLKERETLAKELTKDDIVVLRTLYDRAERFPEFPMEFTLRLDSEWPRGTAEPYYYEVFDGSEKVKGFSGDRPKLDHLKFIIGAERLVDKGLVSIGEYQRNFEEMKSSRLVSITEEGKLVLGAHYSMLQAEIIPALVDAHRVTRE